MVFKIFLKFNFVKICGDEEEEEGEKGNRKALCFQAFCFSSKHN